MRSALTKTNSRVLRLNVGFLLKEGVGASRDFPFDEPAVALGDDLTVRNLNGGLTLTRTPQGLYAQGKLQGVVDHACTRCLVEFEQPVSVPVAELYHYPPDSAPEDAQAVSDDAHIELTPLLRQDFLLSIPMQAVCRPDCRGLCPECGKNWNEGPCDCAQDDTDPRWASLANLLKAEPDDQ